MLPQDGGGVLGTFRGREWGSGRVPTTSGRVRYGRRRCRRTPLQLLFKWVMKPLRWVVKPSIVSCVPTRVQTSYPRVLRKVLGEVSRPDDERSRLVGKEKVDFSSELLFSLKLNHPISSRQAFKSNTRKFPVYKEIYYTRR